MQEISSEKPTFLNTNRCNQLEKSIPIIENMNEKIVLLTGASRGLGYAMAKKFSKNNYKVIITGRNEDTLKNACRELGDKVDYAVFDLEKQDAIPDFVNYLISKYSKIDILINNAGIHLKKDFFEVTDEEFKRIIEVNQNSVFSLCREVAKEMVKNHQGVILNISSMASQYGMPKVIAYTAAKSAIEGMTKAMAVELSPLGIRVNCLAPGFIKTEMSSKALDSDPERKAKVLGRTPMGYLGLPEDVADAAFFLCSDQSKYITGIVMPVDGGNSISF